MTKAKTRIVLAHSGGLDTSIAIPWLSERHAAEVVTVTLDLGQDSELTEIREAALAAGAVRAHVIDASAELVDRYAMPALQAGALHDGCDPLAAALGRAIVAARLVDVAMMERASAIAYGPGLEASVHALGSSLPVITPSILWEMSRADKLAYARARNVHLSSSTDETSAAKTNVWGRSVRRTDGATSSDAAYTLTRSARDCPDEPASLDIDFTEGLPVRVNAIEMPLIEMIESLEIIAGAHGVGRLERVESGADGVATRLSAEAPAAIVLHASHGALERVVTPPDLERLKGDLARVYADLVHQGRWASPTREAIDAFVRTIQPRVTGSVRLKLFKGECEVLEVRSPHAIAADIAEADAGGRFEPAPEGLTS
jgi:argininosuccinate synthase